MGKLTYEELRKIEQMERSTSDLVKLEGDFFRSLSEHILMLEEKLRYEQKTNSGSRKSSFLINEIKNTKRLTEGIYERREKKIVQGALATVRGGTPNLKYLTDREKQFYENLLITLQEGRKMMIMKEKKSMGNNCIIVRVLKDVPQFIGNDMKKYSLKEDDVVTLPQEIARILIERGVAEEIKQG